MSTSYTRYQDFLATIGDSVLRERVDGTATDNAADTLMEKHGKAALAAMSHAAYDETLYVEALDSAKLVFDAWQSYFPELAKK